MVHQFQTMKWHLVKKTYVKVTVTLKTSPTDDVETTTNVILTAKPKANV